MFEETYFGKNTFIEKESLFIFSDTLKEKIFKGLKTAKLLDSKWNEAEKEGWKIVGQILIFTKLTSFSDWLCSSQISNKIIWIITKHQAHPHIIINNYSLKTIDSTNNSFKMTIWLVKITLKVAKVPPTSLISNSINLQ